MNIFKFESKSRNDTIRFGRVLGKFLQAGDIVCLSGNLGSGKTTLTKGIASSFKIKKEDVNSPTFVLMNAYEARMPIYHFDLYRLDNEDEINAIGYEEFFYGKGISIVEWADKLKKLWPKECLKIKLQHKKDDNRLIECRAVGKHYREILEKIKAGL